MSAPGGGHELDFECVGSENVNHGADVSGPETGGREVVSQSDGIQQLVHRASPNTVQIRKHGVG